MSVVARGLLASPIDTLRTMVSNCASFQNLVQAANAAAALAKILFVGQQGDVARPYALVDLSGNSSQAIAGGSYTGFAPSGTLVLVLELPMRWLGTITAQNSATIFTASGLAAMKDDFLTGLQLKMLTGARANETANVSAQVGATGQLTLGSALTGAPVNGDTFAVRPSSSQDAATFFLNTIGDILTDLKALSGTGGCLKFNAVRVQDWGRSPEDKQQDDHYGIRLELDYGV